MLDYKEFPEEKTIEFLIGGKVTTQEFDDVMSRFKLALHNWDEVKVLELVTDFKGIEALALWKDIKFGVNELGEINKKVTKCAVVADTSWVEAITKLADPFVKAEVKFYEPSKESEARDWLKQ